MELKAEKRKTLGKKVKALRRGGVLPAILFGGEEGATPIELNLNTFRRVYDQAGESTLLDLDLGGKKEKILIADVQRAKDGIHVRAGRGKMRGRRWREPRGPLLIVTKPDEVRRSFGNMAGVEIRHVSQIDTEVLAPGGMTGRLTIFSESALEALRGW